MQALRVLPALPTSRIGLRAARTNVQLRTATTSSMPRGSSKPLPRRAVTITTDTGRVPWSELSAREKAARTTQQSTNLVVVLVGIVMTGGVAYIMWREVFSPESKTAVFNRAVDRVRADQRCIELLAGRGKGGQIEAFGQNRAQYSRMARNDFISSKVDTDKIGTDHMRMHFNVQGPLGAGQVNVHMTRPKGENKFRYHLLALDVPGHERVYLENAEQGKFDKRSQGKMFGVRWW